VNQLRTFKLLRGCVVGILLFHFSLMLAMAASESLHCRLHHHTDHEPPLCEVALYQSGAMDECPTPLLNFAEIPSEELPEAQAPGKQPLVTATHLQGGVLAQSPPRAP
jgi:hypothetical protein